MPDGVNSEIVQEPPKDAPPPTFKKQDVRPIEQQEKESQEGRPKYAEPTFSRSIREELKRRGHPEGIKITSEMVLDLIRNPHLTPREKLFALKNSTSESFRKVYKTITLNTEQEVKEPMRFEVYGHLDVLWIAQGTKSKEDPDDKEVPVRKACSLGIGGGNTCGVEAALEGKAEEAGINQRLDARAAVSGHFGSLLFTGVGKNAEGRGIFINENTDPDTTFIVASGNKLKRVAQVVKCMRYGPRKNYLVDTHKVRDGVAKHWTPEDAAKFQALPIPQIGFFLNDKGKVISKDLRQFDMKGQLDHVEGGVHILGVNREPWGKVKVKKSGEVRSADALRSELLDISSIKSKTPQSWLSTLRGMVRKEKPQVEAEVESDVEYLGDAQSTAPIPLKELREMGYTDVILYSPRPIGRADIHFRKWFSDLNSNLYQV